ncbi:VWA domain-containing protein [bacterium]|nr:VWA domain-containing protein [bacterium]
MKSVSLPQLFAFSLTFLFLSCVSSSSPANGEETVTNEVTGLQLPSDSNDLVKLTASLNNLYYYPARTDSGNYLYLEVATNDVKVDEKERKPLNISLVIDRSGSMQGDKLAYVKKAAEFVVDNLNATDFLSIVSYDEEIITEWAAGPVTDKTLIKQKINSLFDRGSTNLGGGLLQGYAEVKKHFNANYTNRVLLLTDGLANVGITNPVQLMQMAKNYNIEHNISLSTFGVGIDYNEDLLQGMAEYGAGNYYFISSPEDIPAIFKQELEGLLAIVAQNSLLEITLPEGVEIEHVYGFKYEKEGSKLKIYFRDLVSGSEKGVLVRLKVNEQYDGDLFFSSQLTYQRAIGDYNTDTLLVNCVLQPARDHELLASGRNAEVEQWVTFYEANLRIEKAMKAVDRGEMDSARTMINYNKSYIEGRKDKWGSNKYIEMSDETNSKYDTVVVEMNEMDEEEIKANQKAVKSENYLQKVRKK